MHNKFLFNIFKAWIPIAIAATIVAGTAYVSVQQVYRMNANDPQVQLVQEAASKLAVGQELKTDYTKLDISKSLNPYLMIFDENKKVILSQASIDGETRVPPAGVFDTAKKLGEYRFTWEPQPGVRSAAVLKYYHSKKTGYVLAGRSLKEVEDRISQLDKITGFGWLLALIIPLVTITLFEKFSHRHHE